MNQHHNSKRVSRELSTFTFAPGAIHPEIRGKFLTLSVLTKPCKHWLWLYCTREVTKQLSSNDSSGWRIMLKTLSFCFQQASCPPKRKSSLRTLVFVFEKTKPMFMKTMTIYCKLKLLLARTLATFIGFL